MFLDWTIILIIPVFILAIYAQNKVKGNYQKYSKVTNSLNLSGSDIAKQILEMNGIYDVSIQPTQGELTDHYNPKKKTVNLSENIYYGNSISAISIAAHEVGHAIQHARNYHPLLIRDNLVPMANLGSTAAFPLFFIGFLFSFPLLMDLGIIFFGLAFLFHVVTLPIEFNASHRALSHLSSNFSLPPKEVRLSKKVLNAAALTYVASALMALMQFIRLIILRGSRD